MCVQAAAHDVQAVRYAGDQVARSDRAASYDIRMSVQVFCAAMQGEVKADLQGAEVYRGGKGVVDHGDEVVGLGKGDDGWEVGDFEEGVAHGFDIDGAGFGADEFFPIHVARFRIRNPRRFRSRRCRVPKRRAFPP